MHRRLLLFATICIVALFIVSQSERVKENFERAEAALVCYWSDPGPPLPVAIPRDPQSVVKGGPRKAPFGKMRGKYVKRDGKPKRMRPKFLKSETTRPLRDIEMTENPTSPSPPFDSSPIIQVPEPTLGVLSVPPEITVTPRPTIV